MHSFLYCGSLAFVFITDWVASPDVPDMAHFAAAIASLVSVGAIFPGVMDFIFSTTSAWFARHIFLSTEKFF